MILKCVLEKFIMRIVSGKDFGISGVGGSRCLIKSHLYLGQGMFLLRNET